MTIIRMPAVREATGISRTTIWRLVKQNQFPAPLKLSERTVGWRRVDVEKWIAERPVAGANIER